VQAGKQLSGVIVHLFDLPDCLSGTSVHGAGRDGGEHMSCTDRGKGHVSGISIAVATPLPSELREIITNVDPSVKLLVDDSLLPPQRYPGDHDGDPAYRRSAAQQREFEALLAAADAFYGIPDTDPAALAAAVRANPKLRWVHTMAAGGGAQVKAAKLSAQELVRVVFTTSAGVHGPTLAEFAMFGLLAGAKDLPRLRRQQAAKQWDRWTMKQVHEQTVLIVGLGGIGKQAARLAKALGARVIGAKRRPGVVPDVDEVHSVDYLPQLVGEADAIILTLPGTTETERLYGAALMAATKPGAVIINVGRGSVIDEDALVESLRSGHLSAAFLDVTAVEPLPPESPLWDMPEVVISPHNAALSAHEDRRIAELFSTNLRHLLAGRPLINVVDTRHFY
jgi:phosphoglycerate dehydrogenase-like enzyme